MPNALASREAVKYDFTVGDEEYFVVVKKQLTVGEEKRIRRIFIRYSLEGKPIPKGQDMEEADVELILVAVVDWNFTDDKGQKLPIDKDTVEKLDPRLYETIKGILNEAYQPPAEEAKNA